MFRAINTDYSTGATSMALEMECWFCSHTPTWEFGAVSSSIIINRENREEILQALCPQLLENTGQLDSLPICIPCEEALVSIQQLRNACSTVQEKVNHWKTSIATQEGNEMPNKLDNAVSQMKSSFQNLMDALSLDAGEPEDYDRLADVDERLCQSPIDSLVSVGSWDYIGNESPSGSSMDDTPGGSIPGDENSVVGHCRIPHVVLTRLPTTSDAAAAESTSENENDGLGDDSTLEENDDVDTGGGNIDSVVPWPFQIEKFKRRLLCNGIEIHRLKDPNGRKSLGCSLCGRQVGKPNYPKVDINGLTPTMRMCSHIRNDHGHAAPVSRPRRARVDYSVVNHGNKAQLARRLPISLGNESVNQSGPSLRPQRKRKTRTYVGSYPKRPCIRCSVCNRVFARVNYLHLHQKAHDNEQKRKEFSSKASKN